MKTSISIFIIQFFVLQVFSQVTCVNTTASRIDYRMKNISIDNKGDTGKFIKIKGAKRGLFDGRKYYTLNNSAIYKKLKPVESKPLIINDCEIPILGENEITGTKWILNIGREKHNYENLKGDKIKGDKFGTGKWGCGPGLYFWETDAGKKLYTTESTKFFNEAYDNTAYKYVPLPLSYHIYDGYNSNEKLEVLLARVTEEQITTLESKLGDDLEVAICPDTSIRFVNNYWVIELENVKFSTYADPPSEDDLFSIPDSGEIN